MKEEQVILVDPNDEPLGLMNKMEAHEKGLLHRAFSIFIFNSNNELLIHQRAFTKYHTPGLWTNTCCSHPRESETIKDAAKRRLMEEMGMQCDFDEAFTFLYKSEVGQGLIEHEYDHVFIGYCNDTPQINPEEVAIWRYENMDNLRYDLKINPQRYTVWFRIAFDRVYEYLKSNNKFSM
ncbi:MAG: isopentenyl-diphosphate Delta-isomerase [Lentimicrobiaceae bacterium]|jgi:isopentenyl-diphosphate delta-isomerase|nr:isopentenyl-diphosphate Delta-isomerase [Lentimicrobiaceae bacterium]